jgi:hypothetical protein
MAPGFFMSGNRLAGSADPVRKGFDMKLPCRKWMVVAGMTMLWGGAAHASNVGVDLNIHVGTPPVVVAPPPAPVIVAPPPAPVERTIIIDDVEEPPEFIYPSQLGFYVAVGIPYDMFFIGSTYYLFRDNVWYRGPHYRGPWRAVSYRSLPPGLRKHRFERIRHYRDKEYRHYRHDRDRYRGRRFRPEREWRERRHDRREMREDRRRDRDERRGHGRGRGHDD